MLSSILSIFHTALFNPILASFIGASLAGEPSFGVELVDICRRESRCNLIGLHERDAWAGRTMKDNALGVGWLDADCVFHRGDPRRFAPRGIHGLSAAYSLRFFEVCLPPEVLDIPLASALAATRRARAQCTRHGACDRSSRRRLWAGANRYDEREALASSSATKTNPSDQSSEAQGVASPTTQL